MGGMEAVELLECACADAWPALVDQPLGQWRMRAADGFTGRANSTLVVGAPDRPLPDALHAVADFAVAHGIPARAQVPVGSRFETGLADAGWQADQRHSGAGGVLVLTGPLDKLAGALPEGVTAEPDAPADWWPLAVDAQAPTTAQRHVLTSGERVAFGVARIAGRLAGVVRGAVVGPADDGLLHISRLAVAREFRRRGLATAVMAALAAWAGPLGVRRYVLQVVDANRGAITLYAGLGGVEHHRYQYWVPA